MIALHNGSADENIHETSGTMIGSDLRMVVSFAGTLSSYVMKRFCDIGLSEEKPQARFI